MKHSNLCNDALMNLNWKIHEGAHALLRYGRGCGDSDGFTVTRGAEFHVERKTSRSDRVTLSSTIIIEVRSLANLTAP